MFRTTAQQSLVDRIESLLEQSRRDQEKRQRATQHEMDQIERRLRHVALVQKEWMHRLVTPRLLDLAVMFPNSSMPACDPVVSSMGLAFRPTPELPMEARVTVSMTPDPSAEKLRVEFAVLMLPMSATYDRGAHMDVLVQSPDTVALEEFLDARIVQFVQDYLRMREPTSPYQAERTVLDPVCRMTIPIVDAAGSTKYKEHVYYFCVEACRRKFEADPARYVRVVEQER